MKNNIVLIGYMGCGKSTIGRQLAKISGRSFVDTDAWIEEKEGVTISKIFAAKGEECFRDMETECLQTLLKENESKQKYLDDLERVSPKGMKGINDKVISVGGGLPVREINQKLLQKLGYVIYLKAKPNTIFERIKGDTSRPLLQTENPLQRIHEMISFRESKYQAAAQGVVEVDGKSVDEIIEEILELK